MYPLRMILTALALGFFLAVAPFQGAEAASLTTTFAGGNGCQGNFFDVTTAGKSLAVNRIAVNTSSLTPTVSVYTRTGTFQGNTNSSAGWTLVGVVNAVGAGIGNPTLVDIPDFTLLANAVTGMFVHVTEGITYTNGPGLGVIVAQNADLSITDGVGQCAGVFSGGNNFTRTWNGTIFYDEGPAVPPGPTDTVAPSVVISGAPRITSAPFNVSFDFSEAVLGFVAGDAVVGNGRLSNFRAASASRYTATISPASQGDVTIDVPAAVAADAAGNDNTAATQVSVSFNDEDFIRSRTQRVISNFMTRRADQITAAEPDLSSRLGSGGGEASQPMTLTGAGDDDASHLGFSTSLRQIVAAADKHRASQQAEFMNRMGLGAKDMEGDGGTSVAPLGFDIWTKGQFAKIDAEAASHDLALFHIGFDYRFSNDLVVGVLSQFDWSDEVDTTNDFAIDGHGWMVGPYLVARLHENLIFDGRAAIGGSENTVSPFATYKDKFTTDRLLARATLTGDFQYGEVKFAPHVGVIYFEEDQNAYTDNFGFRIPDQTISLGRLTFGPKLSTQVALGDGSVLMPHIAIKGIWDFDAAEVVDLNTGLATGTEDLRGRVDGGLALTSAHGFTVAGQAFYDGIGADEFEAYGGGITVVLPLN